MYELEAGNAWFKHIMDNQAIDKAVLIDVPSRDL
jgi:hypothetical protein